MGFSLSVGMSEDDDRLVDRLKPVLRLDVVMCRQVSVCLMDRPEDEIAWWTG
jgi:hypothetical protein